MHVVKLGIPHTCGKGEFHFVCKHCGCEWYADRGDKGLSISPPCFEFFAYMDCPNCKTKTYDR